MNETGLIYIATHKDSGKIYVGQTIQRLERRLSVHLWPSNRTYFGNALRKDGIDAFTFELIECPIEELTDIECSLIASFESKSPNGFNLTDGGDGMRGYIPSDETRKKISIGITGRPISDKVRKIFIKANQNRIVSEKTRKKLSEASRGHKMPQNTKIKLREANLGHCQSKKTKEKLIAANIGNKYWVGRHHSEESKLKIGTASKGRNVGVVRSKETRKKMSEAKIEYWKRKRME